MRRPTTALAVLTVWLIAGPWTPGARADATMDYRAVNHAAVDRHIVPGYEALARAGDGLKVAADAFCAAPDAAGLEALRGAYHAAWDAWVAIRHIDFGPVQYLSRIHRIQFWPDARNILGRHLAGLLADADPARLEPDAFAEASVAVQGLPALERLLFGDDAAALLAGDAAARYRCDVVAAIGRNMATMTAGVLTDWIEPEGYRWIMLQAGEGGPVYETAAEATVDLVTSLLSSLEALRDARLMRPLGGEAKLARPRLAEAWRAGDTLRTVVVTLDALHALYRLDGDGFGAALRANGQAALDDAVETGFAEARAQAAALDGPVDALFRSAEGRRRVAALADRLHSLRELLAKDVAPALGIAPGFNSLDGD